MLVICLVGFEVHAVSQLMHAQRVLHLTFFLFLFFCFGRVQSNSGELVSLSYAC